MRQLVVGAGRALSRKIGGGGERALGLDAVELTLANYS